MSTDPTILAVSAPTPRESDTADAGESPRLRRPAVVIVIVIVMFMGMTVGIFMLVVAPFPAFPPPTVGDV